MVKREAWPKALQDVLVSLWGLDPNPSPCGTGTRATKLARIRAAHLGLLTFFYPHNNPLSDWPADTMAKEEVLAALGSGWILPVRRLSQKTRIKEDTRLH